MSTDFDVMVVGAGVVGLACAEALAHRGLSVLCVERNSHFGQEISSRNSGVIHAGIYYPSGSLKAQLCRRGRELLYARCAREDIPHRKIGKLLVASTQDESPRLEKIHRVAEDNGVSLSRLSRADLRSLEPELRVHSALWSSESGIIDVHELMYRLHSSAQKLGVVFSFRSEVSGLLREANLWRAKISSGEETSEIRVGKIVNAAGLLAQEFARLAQPHSRPPPLHPCKGQYFTVHSKHARRVSHLIYPLPVQAGLGIHLTFDLGGQLLAGPDTNYVETPSFDVDDSRRREFALAVSQYLPGVEVSDLSPAYAGVRPKLHGPEEDFRDFLIENSGAGLVNLFGIESPGLTACLAIAEEVVRII